MKKVLLMSAVLACSSLQVNAEIQSRSVVFYGGAGLTAGFTKSDFSMDYSVEPLLTEAIPYVNHKKNHIGRVGGEIFLGAKSKCKDGWFWAGELSYGFAKLNHKHDFTEREDAEEDKNSLIPGRISYIDVEHGNELGLVGKFGRSIKFWNVYGILGVTTKKVEIKYGMDDSHFAIADGKGFEINPSKRVYGAVFGIGVSKQVHDKVSCEVEYKYKLYQDAKKDVDLKGATYAAFNDEEHDTSDRHLKVKSDKHEVSLRVAVNI